MQTIKTFTLLATLDTIMITSLTSLTPQANASSAPSYDFKVSPK